MNLFIVASPALLLAGCLGTSLAPPEHRQEVDLNWANDMLGSYAVHIQDPSLFWDEAHHLLHGTYRVTETRGFGVDIGTGAHIDYRDPITQQAGRVQWSYPGDNYSTLKSGAVLIHLRPYETRIFNASIPIDFNVAMQPKITLAIEVYPDHEPLPPSDPHYSPFGSELAIKYYDYCLELDGSRYVHNYTQAARYYPEDPGDCEADGFYYAPDYFKPPEYPKGGMGEHNSRYYIEYNDDRWTHWPPPEDASFWSHYCSHCYNANVHPERIITYNDTEPFCEGDVRGPEAGGGSTGYIRGCGYDWQRSQLNVTV